MMRQPFPQHVCLEGLPAAPGITLLARPNAGFGFLPGVVGVLLVGEGASGPFLAADVEVVGRVAGLAVPAGALAREPHDHPIDHLTVI